MARTTRLSVPELDLTLSPAPLVIVIIGDAVSLGPRTVEISRKLTLVLEAFDPNGECIDGVCKEVAEADPVQASAVGAEGGGDVVRRVANDVRGGTVHESDDA